MRSATRSRASLATFSSLSLSEQHACDPQRRRNEPRAVERNSLPASRFPLQQGRPQMKHNATLTIRSLLSILLFAFHWVDEVSRGMETGGLSALAGVLILVVWLYGTLVLAARRSGYIIMLLGGIFGLGVLVLHMKGTGIVGRRIANTSGISFWVWTLIALGVTST